MNLGHRELLYLLDANVPINANRDYYPLERVPQFWEWLDGAAAQNQAKIPLEIFEEITAGKPDAFIQWLRDHQPTLLLQEESSTSLVRRVIEEGYELEFDQLNDQDLTKMGQDPFLIAHTLADPADRVVVSNEVSRPSRIGANRHVPDVCSNLGIRCINAFDLIRELDFRAS